MNTSTSYDVLSFPQFIFWTHRLFAPLSWAAFILLLTAVIFHYQFRIFKKYPASMIHWVAHVACAAMLIEVIKWTPDLNGHSISSSVNISTIVCKFLAAYDNVSLISVACLEAWIASFLFVNIVLEKDYFITYRRYLKIATIVSTIVLGVITTIATFLSDVWSEGGFCSSSKTATVFAKLIPIFVLWTIQFVFAIPTLVRLIRPGYSTNKSVKKDKEFCED